jgi:hypothetical protein
MLSSSLCDQIIEAQINREREKVKKKEKKKRKREKRESVFQIPIKKERKSKRTKEQRTIISDLLFNTLDASNIN